MKKKECKSYYISHIGILGAIWNARDIVYWPGKITEWVNTCCCVAERVLHSSIS